MTGPLVGFETEALRFDRLIGCGAMGEVYDGMQRALGRRVAIKVIAPHLAPDERTRARFQREAQIMSKLQHPHVVTCYDLVRCVGPQGQDLHLLVLEYVDGSHLGLISAEPAPVRRVLELAAQAAAGLHAAHELGILHRDIKPENILVTRGGSAKLADFGLARAVNVLSDTQTGTILGTPAYMAPETCAKGLNSRASDIYAFGCTLYHVLSGATPYTGINEMAVLLQHNTAPIPKLSARRADLAPLDPFIARCMAKDPAARWPDADAMARELDALVRAVSRRSCCGAVSASDAEPEAAAAEPASAPAAGAAEPPPTRPSGPIATSSPSEVVPVWVGMSTVRPGGFVTPRPPRRAFVLLLVAATAIAIAVAVLRGHEAQAADDLLERVRQAVDEGRLDDAKRLLRPDVAPADPSASR